MKVFHGSRAEILRCVKANMSVGAHSSEGVVGIWESMGVGLTFGLEKGERGALGLVIDLGEAL